MSKLMLQLEVERQPPCYMLWLAIHQKTKLLLTYKARLKVESRRRAGGHSFGNKYNSKACYKVGGLRAVMDDDRPPVCDIPSFDLLVLDEAQDITELLYEFFHKVLRDYQVRHAGRLPQFMVTGDEHQAIFGYKGADARFLTMASKVLWNRRAWHWHALTESFRVTCNIEAFVNRVMLGRTHVRACKEPGDLVGIAYTCASHVYQLIANLLRSGRAVAEDVLILAPSIKSQSRTPLKVLENLLSDAGIHVHVPAFDDGEVAAEELTRGKVAFATFHQVKGLERRVVVVFNFSRQYFA